jgi:hypothetical protein
MYATHAKPLTDSLTRPATRPRVGQRVSRERIPIGLQAKAGLYHYANFPMGTMLLPALHRPGPVNKIYVGPLLRLIGGRTE